MRVATSKRLVKTNHIKAIIRAVILGHGPIGKDGEAGVALVPKGGFDCFASFRAVVPKVVQDVPDFDAVLNVRDVVMAWGVHGVIVVLRYTAVGLRWLPCRSDLRNVPVVAINPLATSLRMIGPIARLSVNP